MGEVDLVEEATKIRRALEALAQELEFFESFPVGTCGNVTELMGQWLVWKGVVGLENVYGERQDGCTHAWLELDGLIIDITADQFPDAMPEIFVGRDRSFHNSFTVNSRHEHQDNPSLRIAFAVVAAYLQDYQHKENLT